MELQHVNFSYGPTAPAIWDLTATLRPGRITTLIGPNGAGKSTVLKLLSGALTPQSGQVLVGQTPLQSLSLKARAQQVATVSQHHQLFDDMTVADLVKMGRLPYHGLLGTVADQEIASALSRTGLATSANVSVNQLSGGQQQRVWIARALAQEAQILVLDEPTTYLDLKNQRDLMALIRQLVQAQGLTVIQVLHDINQAFAVSDDIWLMAGGRLVKTGPAQDLFDTTILSATFQTNMQLVTIPTIGPYIVQPVM